MSYLLDTNVISEPLKRAPEPAVVAWLASADETSLYLSTTTLAEIRQGIERLAPGRARRAMERWLSEDLIERFAGRLIAVDIPVSQTWGEITARRIAAGRAMPVMDAFIAATAAVYGLTLVTRNTRDFEALGLDLLNPWSDA